jgi:hypothetical protein
MERDVIKTPSAERRVFSLWSEDAHHAGNRLHDPAGRDVRMSDADTSRTNTASHTADTPQLLLEHHLKELRLPTILREYDKVARQCAVEQVDYPRSLLRMTELELLDRERRAMERRIRQAKFPAVKTVDSFDFLTMPSVNKSLLLELARCEFLARGENVLLLGNSGTGKTHIALVTVQAFQHRSVALAVVTTDGMQLSDVGDDHLVPILLQLFRDPDRVSTCFHGNSSMILSSKRFATPLSLVRKRPSSVISSSSSSMQ